MARRGPRRTRGGAGFERLISRHEDPGCEHARIAGCAQPSERGVHAVADNRMIRVGDALSAYQWMWLFALFDLPVTTTTYRREYARFRAFLLSQGFCMLQYSVYARHCVSEESGESLRKRVGQAVPAHGQVRLLLVTDRQFGKMEVYVGKSRTPAEEPPPQLYLF
jgi:CRISPR-associated protein Cas2